MKKFLLPLLLILVTLIGLTSCNLAKDEYEDKDISGLAFSYLAGEEKSKLNVFNFKEEQILDDREVDFEEEFPYGMTTINPVEETSLTMIQRSKPYGYTFYLQSPKDFEKIGMVKERVFGGTFLDNYIYAITFEKEKAILKKYKRDNLEKEIASWKIDGNPEKLVVDYENKTIYILSRTNKILLYTIKKDKMKKKEVLNDSYEVNAQIHNDDLWITVSQVVKANQKQTNNKEEKKIIVYNTNEEKITNTYQSKHPPKYAFPLQNQIVVISGTPNVNYLEVVTNENKILSSKELEAKGVFGVVEYEEENYIFARNGIYKIENTSVKKIEKESVSDSIDLMIN
jgi:hypothetical protein